MRQSKELHLPVLQFCCTCRHDSRHVVCIVGRPLQKSRRPVVLAWPRADLLQPREVSRESSTATHGTVPHELFSGPRRPANRGFDQGYQHSRQAARTHQNDPKCHSRHWPGHTSRIVATPKQSCSFCMSVLWFGGRVAMRVKGQARRRSRLTICPKVSPRLCQSLTLHLHEGVLQPYQSHRSYRRCRILYELFQISLVKKRSFPFEDALC